MSSRTYLDWNATAPLREEARAAMSAAMALSGNPSSIHGEGRAARKVIEAARESVAALVGAKARNVIFTSGGTEANVMALTPHMTNGKDTRVREVLLVSAIEHPSVRAGGRFAADQVRNVPVTTAGVVDLTALAAVCAPYKAQDKGFLVSLMLANNETGVIQPIAQAAEIIHAAGGLLHVDAVQAAGKIPCDMTALGADLMTLSAHKIGGPKGVGALVLAREELQVNPVFTGGGQERSTRAGTENLIGIAGFGAAAAAARGTDLPYSSVLATLRDDLERDLRARCADAVVFGQATARLPNTSLFAVPGIKAETALIALDLAGFAVSSGSACSSGKVSVSHVLTAMGVPGDLAACAIRLSIGSETSKADLEKFLAAWSKHVATLSKGSRSEGSAGLAA